MLTIVKIQASNWKRYHEKSTAPTEWKQVEKTQELLRIAHRKLKACWRKKGGGEWALALLMSGKGLLAGTRLHGALQLEPSGAASEHDDMHASSLASRTEKSFSLARVWIVHMGRWTWSWSDGHGVGA